MEDATSTPDGTGFFADNNRQDFKKITSILNGKNSTLSAKSTDMVTSAACSAQAAAAIGESGGQRE